MNQRMKIEFADSGVSTPQRPVSEDSSISNTNIVAPPLRGLQSKQPVVAGPSNKPARDASHGTQFPLADVLPLISDAPMLASESLEQPVTMQTQKEVPATQSSLPPVKATSTPAAKSPCNCGCGKKKSKKAKKSLVISVGEKKVFAKCAQFDKIENKGKIELAEGASLTAAEIINSGIISSQFDLTLNAENFTLADGTVESPSKITLASKSDLIVRGGDFRAPSIKFDAEGKLDVYAHRMDGKVFVKGSGVSFGVKSGDLNVVEHVCVGDPVYWHESTTGTLSLGDILTGGEDLVIWSNSPSISVGSIDTITGGSGPGRVTIITNAGATRPGTPSENPYDCSDCSSFVPSGGGGGTVLINADFIPSINSSGPIEIRGDLISDGYIWIETPYTLSGSGGSNTVKIAGTVTSSGQPVIIRAGNKVQVDGDITTGSSTVGGSLEIQAYKGADGSSSTEFVIGGSGQSNGVNGNIDCSASTSRGGIFVRNYGTGGIKLESTSAVNVQISNGKSGDIYLDAKDGALTLPSGTISVDGTGSNAAGRIIIMGDSIVATAGATTLSASDAGGIDFHKVQMAAATYSFGSGGLTVKSNGGGGQQNDASIGIFSKGSIIITSTVNPPVYQILTTVTPDTTKSITINGSGALKLEANSLNAGPRQIWCMSKDMTFNGGTVEMECHGKDGLVKVWSFGDMKFAGGAATLKSNGYQDSDGGFVDMYCHTFERTSTSTLEMHADGDGKGNGGRAQLWADTLGTNTITFGRTNGSVHATADGGSADGSGGRIDIVSGSATASGAPIVIKDSTDPQNPVLSVAPKGNDGDGGSISVRCAGNVTFNEANNKLSADGKGNGKGGSIDLSALRTSAALDLGDNIVSAKGGDTGDGGTILLTSNTALTMKAAKLTVTVGQGDKSNGKGGTIYGKSEAGDITVEGTLNTDGKGKGKGGKIILDAKQTLNYGTNDFTAKGGNKGDGGLIWLKSGTNFTIAGSKTHVDPGQDQDSNGEGGTIQIESGADLTITGTMNANGKGKGKGGNIYFKAEEALTIDNSNLNAKGGCLGHGGVFVSESDTINDDGTSVALDSGDGTCSNLFTLADEANTRGGKRRIVVKAGGQLRDNLTNNGSGSGDGGIYEILSDGSFTLGSHTVTCNGGPSGGGGTIILRAKGFFEVNANQLLVSSGSSASKDKKGGRIEISVKTQDALVVTGTLNVSGKGNASGGDIVLKSGSFVDISNAHLHADGFEDGDGGNGGTIRILNGFPTLFPSGDNLPLRLSARASKKGSGKGGSVTIERAITLVPGTGINVHDLINVDGGDDAELSTPWGSVELNKHKIQQWRIQKNDAEWPKSYWTSINTKTPFASPDLAVVSAAAGLQRHIREQLKRERIQVYVMEKIDDAEEFFNSAINGFDVAGFSLKFPRASMVFSQLHNGKQKSPNLGMQFAITHELAHQLNYRSWNSFSDSNFWKWAFDADTGIGRGINDGRRCTDLFFSDTCNKMKKEDFREQNWKTFQQFWPGISSPLEIMCEIFAVAQNSLLNRNYRHALEREVSGVGELRKAYTNFATTTLLMKVVIGRGRP